MRMTGEAYHFFQRPIGSFRVQCPDDGDAEEVDDTKHM